MARQVAAHPCTEEAALGIEVKILFASQGKKIGTQSPTRLAGNAQLLLIGNVCCFCRVICTFATLLRISWG